MKSRKLLSLLLAAVMLISVTACAGNEGSTETDAKTEAVTEEKIAETENEEYVVVIDKADDNAVSAAERMTWQMKEVFGTDIKVIDQAEGRFVREIVLGKTNRGEKIDTSKLIRDEFEIKTVGTKVFIDGASADGLYGGAVKFLSDCTDENGLKITDNFSYKDTFEYPVKKLTIEGNDISKYTVYHPEGADEFVKAAAEDISYYIAEATGVKLPVKTGTPEGLYIAIVTVESDKEFDDSFEVKCENGSVTISGHANLGAVYGAYDFLEQYVGVRYITSDIDYIKPAESIDITDVNYSEAPYITYRILYHIGYTEIVPSGISVKNKSKRDIRWAGNSCHTFDELDGDYSVQYENQPCLTDPEVFDFMLANVKKRLEAYPNADIISISQNDNSNYCKCDACVEAMKKYAPDPDNYSKGGPAGLMIDFVNRMSDEIVKVRPNIKIHTFAYLYTEEPPVGITARDNIAVQFCPISNCFNHPFTHSCYANKGFSEKVSKWSEIVSEVLIWDYSYQWDLDGTPYPTMGYNEVVTNYQLFIDNNVSYVFNNNDFQLNNGEFIALHSYLLTKVMWNPYITEEEYYGYMKDFIAGFYGDGWESIYNAIMMVEDNYTRCVSVDYKTPAQNMMHMYMKSYIDDVIAKMADGRLKTDTAFKFANADCVMAQYEWVKLDLVFNSLYKSEDPADNEKVQEMCKALYSKFVKYNLRFVDSIENPTLEEIGEFDRIPSEWGALVGEVNSAKENSEAQL